MGKGDHSRPTAVADVRPDPPENVRALSTHRREKPPWRMNGRRRQSKVREAPTSAASVSEQAVGAAGQLSNLPPNLERVLALVEDSTALVRPLRPVRTRQAQTRVSTEVARRLVQDYSAGEGIRDLATRYGVCRETIYSLLRAHGVKPSRQRPPLKSPEVGEVREHLAAVGARGHRGPRHHRRSQGPPRQPTSASW